MFEFELVRQVDLVDLCVANRGFLEAAGLSLD